MPVDEIDDDRSSQPIEADDVPLTVAMLVEDRRHDVGGAIAIYVCHRRRTRLVNWCALVDPFGDLVVPEFDETAVSPPEHGDEHFEVAHDYELRPVITAQVVCAKEPVRPAAGRVIRVVLVVFEVAGDLEGAGGEVENLDVVPRQHRDLEFAVIVEVANERLAFRGPAIGEPTERFACPYGLPCAIGPVQQVAGERIVTSGPDLVLPGITTDHFVPGQVREQVADPLAPVKSGAFPIPPVTVEVNPAPPHLVPMEEIPTVTQRPGVNFSQIWKR